MATTHQQILHAYRNLYKHVLRAVQYSKPARFVARDHIRNAFRNGSQVDYDAAKVSRTLEFLDGAARMRGIEHKIVKNLMRVWWEKAELRGFPLTSDGLYFRKEASKEFDHTVEMLNKTMGLCIK